MSVAQEFAQAFGLKDPFQWVTQFKAATAAQALRYGEAQLDNLDYSETFENFDLETKLWHLVSLLYEYRNSETSDSSVPELEFSSDAVKQHNFLLSNHKTKEIALIISWIQENSKQIEIPANISDKVKWNATRTHRETLKLHVLSSSSNDNYISQLDDDAPLRSGKDIYDEDKNQDKDVFNVIYNLILQSRFDEAVEVANTTGNFALALILVGAVNDYVDPVLDQKLFNDNNVNNSVLVSDSMAIDSVDSTSSAPSGQKHKHLWRQAVFQLAKRTQNPSERLIYNYLCGGDISDNVALTDTWEHTLLLYLNQLFCHQMLGAVYGNEEAISNILIPSPQCSTIEEILNVILRNGNTVSSRELKNPLRVLSGTVMINKVGQLLSSGAANVGDDPHLLRVLTHLAIFVSSCDSKLIDDSGLTQIIGQYIKYLGDQNLEELIPVYLAYIPEESEARELYSEFLTTLVDPMKRGKQIALARQMNNPFFQENEEEEEDYVVVDSNTSNTNDTAYEGKLVNVLRRTVEKVMTETASAYRPDTLKQLILQDSVVDLPDMKLYRAVDWFFETDMYEDAIVASITTIRRFLLSGKLKSLKSFGSDKNFLQLIKDYDFASNTKILSNNYEIAVSENDKEELQQYSEFLKALTHIDEWKSFLKDNQVNGVLVGTKKFWESSYVQTAIEKVTSSLLGLIFNWLRRLMTVLKDHQLLAELRSIYVPYLTVELLQIYQYSRFNNWKYIRNAFELINSIANDEDNDLLKCFINSGRLNELVHKSGQVAAEASERGITGIFAK